MSKRARVSMRHSKKLFSRTADNQRVHPKNFLFDANKVGPMRGGIRA